jgi:hypothetical protein
MTYSSPHDKVLSKVLPVLGGGRVEGLSVVLGHGGVFGQGFEEGDGGVEEPFVCRVGVFGHHGGELVDVVVVEIGAGCGGGVEVLGGHGCGWSVGVLVLSCLDWRWSEELAWLGLFALFFSGV